MPGTQIFGTTLLEVRTAILSYLWWSVVGVWKASRRLDTSGGQVHSLHFRNGVKVRFKMQLYARRSWQITVFDLSAQLACRSAMRHFRNPCSSSVVSVAKMFEPPQHSQRQNMNMTMNIVDM
jgi:hypothetical protein